MPSLYPDGRYAHLWRTYQSPSSLFTSDPTTQARDDVSAAIATFRARKSDVGAAALGNCIMERLAEDECFSSGTLMRKLGGCRPESRAFSRCFELQARLLRGLGYMSHQPGLQGDEVRERMRMRADEIWTEVRRREGEVERAKQEGMVEPVFPPLRHLGREWIKKTEEQKEVEARRWDRETEEAVLGRFNEAMQAALRERIKGLPAHERELEVKLELAEAESHLEYGKLVADYYRVEAEERRARKAQGQSTLGDWLKGFGNWTQ